MSSAYPRWRKAVSMAAVTVVAGAIAVAAAADPAQAAQTIGYPTFTGAAIPQPPVG